MLNYQHYYSQLSTNSRTFRLLTFRRCVNDIMIHADKICYKYGKFKFTKKYSKIWLKST